MSHDHLIRVWNTRFKWHVYLGNIGSAICQLDVQHMIRHGSNLDIQITCTTCTFAMIHVCTTSSFYVYQIVQNCKTLLSIIVYECVCVCVCVCRCVCDSLYHHHYHYQFSIVLCKYINIRFIIRRYTKVQ